MEFHISRRMRERYQFDDSLFSLNGNVIFANFHAARVFAQKLNQKNDLVSFPERAVKAGQINALGLVDEILHLVVALYRRQKNPTVMQQALDWLRSRMDPSEVDRALLLFISEFPPMAVYRKEMTAQDYLTGSSEGISNRSIALEEMLMLWITNKNPAVAPYIELFDDDLLESGTAYTRIITELHSFFDQQPPFGPDQQNLIDMLRSPALAVPHSLSGQLEYIRQRWGEILGRYFYRLLSSLDLIKEEEKVVFGGPGAIPVPVYSRALAEAEPERFSSDKEWMPHLVLLAKNIYVWLDQLSRKYSRSITHLDQIPDEELDTLAQWGFSGLWLIGVWERSKASARIKQLCGNPEAIASAYSLAAYQVAADLGGEVAFQDLRSRAWLRGIRMGSDMVPNHMGIDSQWVIEHPDWFISLDYSPYPAYAFTGPDFSSDNRASIFIEDHYYTRTDAAVVFKHVDNRTGQVRYIYHGNDGTNMPWNDTAQLNYLKPEVREAVIQNILNVARQFPIIRFDAAMTLAKRHYQRLWFPEPGSGGDIPSRSEQGMTRQQLDTLMPVEFWREVVDRAAVEAPDTLLLAEAFWLMEGYFVRTLGMHRVYNSAFMNMLRNEDNAKYRLVLKNTLEFDPEILKRFVNFMNNPDERTAVDQFGSGDKYFGICTMMVTLPGLPMFGPGQIEGFTEKYGMEYRRAYYDEKPDPYLIERHKREIFPLLQKRSMFSGVDNFLLYDVFSSDGKVDEDILAFSNGIGAQRNLVVYLNKFASAQSWIRYSVSFLNKNAPEGQRNIIQRSLAQGLNISAGDDTFTIMRDHVTGLQYIHPNKELAENGLFVDLNAYQYHVFLDIHEVHDDAWHSYRRLYEYLNGRGVPDIQEALKELILQPVQQPFNQIANPAYFNYLLSIRLSESVTELPENILDEAAQKMNNLLSGIEYLNGTIQAKGDVLAALRQELETLLSFEAEEADLPLPTARSYRTALEIVRSGLTSDAHWLALFVWVFVHNLGKTVTSTGYENQTQSWIDEWQFSKILNNSFQAMGLSEQSSWRITTTIRLLTGQQNWYESQGLKPLSQILENWLANDEIQHFLGINRYQETLWFNKESFEDFIWWMLTLVVLKTKADRSLNASSVIENILGAVEIYKDLKAALEGSDYQVNKLLQAITPTAAVSSTPTSDG